MATKQSHRSSIHRSLSSLELGRKTIGAARSTGTEYWHPAPPGSHIESFKLVDARLQRQTDLPEVGGRGRLAGALSFLAELWPGRRRAAPRSNPDEPDSSLFIRYAGGVEYEYFTSDHDYLESVYAQMCNAQRPGEIVWSHLIQRLIPCRRTD